MDGMTRGATRDQRDRSGKYSWPNRWRQCEPGWEAADEPPAAMQRNRTAAHHQILSGHRCRDAARLGCAAFGESREQEAAAKVAEVDRCGGDRRSATVRWHMVGNIQRNKARSIARVGLRGAFGEQHPGWSPRWTGRHAARSPTGTRRTAAGLCADQHRRRRSRGGVDLGRRGGGRRGLRAGRRARRPGAGRGDGDSAAGLGPRRGLCPAARTPPGAWQPSERPGMSAGMSGRPRNRGQTRFDLCACRYRANGTTTATVT